jgi:hypothetical protein
MEQIAGFLPHFALHISRSFDVAAKGFDPPQTCNYGFYPKDSKSSYKTVRVRSPNGTLYTLIKEACE